VTLALVLLVINAVPALAQSRLPTPPELYPNPWKSREPTDEEKLFNAVLAGDKSAVPKLTARFNAEKNATAKGTIASVLMRAGVKDEVFFDYVSSEARKSIDSDAPLPLVYGPDGRLLKKKWNPEFLEWCKKHGLDPYDTAMDMLYKWPEGLLFLASSGDPRGYDLLIKAVHSKNFEIAILASRGLVLMRDPRAIDEIIAACEAAPSSEASSLAWALVYFNDPRAQHAAEKFITDNTLLASLRDDAAEHGTKSLFGW
jgi:hypothetical protein